MIFIVALASPTPAPSATPRAPFVLVAQPTLPPDFTSATNAANETNLLYAIFAPYCAKDGGISRLALSPGGYPASVECVKQRLSIGADLKVSRLGP